MSGLRRWGHVDARTPGARARVEIRRYYPARRLLFRLGIGILAIVALTISHIAGRWITAPRASSEAANMAELEAQLRAAQGEIRILEQQLSTAQAAVIVERAAASEVRSDLSEAQARADRLSRESELYLSLMDSSIRTRGLTLYKLELRPARAMGAFSYRITLLQRAQHHVELQGTITLSVRGKRKGKAETLSGKYLGPVGIDRVPLRFLYFQILEGELQIPEGFEPEQIRMMLDIVKGRPQKLDFVREWNPQGG